METVKVELTEAIEAHGKTYKVLELRRPRAKEIIRNGYPIKARTDGAMEVDPSIVAKYVSDLAGIPPSSVESLSILDFQALIGEVVSFFAGAPQTSST